MTAERLMPEQIAECKKHGRWRLNLSRHPILRAIYEATRAVDELPLATEAATAAVTLVGVLAERAATILDENDAQGERIKELERERDEARQQRDSVTRDYFKQQRRADTNEAERDAAIRRAEADAKDAGRYRWLRGDGYANADNNLPHVIRWRDSEGGLKTYRILDNDQLDAAIDSALQSDERAG